MCEWGGPGGCECVSGEVLGRVSGEVLGCVCVSGEVLGCVSMKDSSGLDPANGKDPTSLPGGLLVWDWVWVHGLCIVSSGLLLSDRGRQRLAWGEGRGAVRGHQGTGGEKAGGVT